MNLSRLDITSITISKQAKNNYVTLIAGVALAVVALAAVTLGAVGNASQPVRSANAQATVFSSRPPLANLHYYIVGSEAERDDLLVRIHEQSFDVMPEFLSQVHVLVAGTAEERAVTTTGLWELMDAGTSYSINDMRPPVASGRSQAASRLSGSVSGAEFTATPWLQKAP